MILPRVVRSGEMPKYSCAQPLAILQAAASYERRWHRCIC